MFLVFLDAMSALRRKLGNTRLDEGSLLQREETIAEKIAFRLELTQVLGQVFFELHVDVARFHLVLANLLSASQSLLFPKDTGSSTSSSRLLLGSQFGGYRLVDRRENSQRLLETLGGFLEDSDSPL